jgi:hypothetical protein
MKIVPIFADKLFAFHYENEEDNEYDRLMNLWNDAEYIYEFLKANKRDISNEKNLKNLALKIIDDAEEIDQTLIQITEKHDAPLSQFFKPLYNHEYKVKILSLQKGRESLLRMYAIRIDDNIFIIVGGAIKLPLHHLMEDREHTKIELNKLNFAKDHLQRNGVFDEDSFFEFLNEA